MTFHLEGPWLSTTSTKKRTEKLTKARQEELERDWRSRNKWLIDLKLPKQTFEQYLDWLYGRGEKNTKKTDYSKRHSSTTTPSILAREETAGSRIPRKVSTEILPATDALVQTGKKNTTWVTGPCTTKQTPTYTGTKIIGIGTMHKSNAVPIFSDDEAKDISSMRR